MSQVSDVIEKGQDVPDDVTSARDRDRDAWRITSTGHWHTAGLDVACEKEPCPEDGLPTMLRYAPLTVTAVREPEPDDEPVHYYISEFSPSGATLCGVGIADDLSTTDEPGKATCTNCRAAADDEPRPESPALLDLVRQYGDQRGMLEVRRPHMAAANAERWDASNAALFDRIAALVPQQPLVSVPLRERDELRAKLAESEISVAAMRATIDTLYALLGVEGAGVEVAVGAIEALKATASPPDPSVLSLPTVPDGTQALIGDRTGLRYTLLSHEVWGCEEYSGRIGTVLQREGSVTVVMREPRTVDALTPDMDLDMALLRGVSGRVWRREAVGPGWVTKGEHRCNIGDLFFTDGPLTEVFEDEPGGVS